MAFLIKSPCVSNTIGDRLTVASKNAGPSKEATKVLLVYRYALFNIKIK